MTNNQIAVSNIKLGDIYYVQVNKRYYFLQVIHIAENVAHPYGEQYQFGYFIVVLNQTFLELPTAIDGIDLTSIFQPKYIWRKTLFYFGLWDKEPCIRFDKSLMRYDYKDKYTLVKFGNAPVAETFKPAIDLQFSMPVICEENDDGVKISPSLSSIQTVIWAIEEEEKGKIKKRNAIVPRYFNEWLEYLEPDCIVKTEKIIAKFSEAEVLKLLQKELKKAVIAINKLDEKYNFISTIEAENLVEKLLEISITKGMLQQEAMEIVDSNRDW